MLPATQTYSLLPSAVELEQTMRFSDAISKSSFCPAKYRNHPEDVLVAILMGLEVGLKPMQALQNIAVINDRPCVWGDAALALVQASGELEYIEEKIEGNLETNAMAHCTVKRKGMSNGVTRSFGVDDAKRAGLWTRDTYKKYPARMLQMRARSWVLRDAFPDVLKGLNIREEIEDYPLEKEIKPMSKANPLMEELKNELKGNTKPIGVADMREKIKSADSKDTLTQLTEEIKNGDFSEQDKVEIRKVFKEKKDLLTHQKSDVAKESIRSIKNTFNNN